MTLLEQQRMGQGRARRGQGQRAGQQGGRGGQEQQVNVSEAERTTSVAAGAILALLGLRRRSIPGVLLMGAGGMLIQRGVSGYCGMYQKLGINSERESQQGRSREQQIAEQGVKVRQAMLITKPAEELYRFWRNFENLPRIMGHLESVKVLDEKRSHWVARAKIPGGTVEWDAEITADEPNKRIAWRSIEGSGVDTAGEIRFAKALGDRGTEVHIDMSYVPPGGMLGHYVAAMLGQNPKRIVREDLRNFKRLMEVGEILTLIGQPHGTCTGQGKPYTESDWEPLFM